MTLKDPDPLDPDVGLYAIQLASNPKGSYRTILTTTNRAQAYAVYNGYNIHSGAKKRLLYTRNGFTRTVQRLITHKYE